MLTKPSINKFRTQIVSYLVVKNFTKQNRTALSLETIVIKK